VQSSRRADGAVAAAGGAADNADERLFSLREPGSAPRISSSSQYALAAADARGGAAAARPKSPATFTASLRAPQPDSRRVHAPTGGASARAAFTSEVRDAYGAATPAGALVFGRVTSLATPAAPSPRAARFVVDSGSARTSAGDDASARARDRFAALAPPWSAPSAAAAAAAAAESPRSITINAYSRGGGCGGGASPAGGGVESDDGRGCSLRVTGSPPKYSRVDAGATLPYVVVDAASDPDGTSLGRAVTLSPTSAAVTAYDLSRLAAMKPRASHSPIVRPLAVARVLGTQAAGKVAEVRDAALAWPGAARMDSAGEDSASASAASARAGADSGGPESADDDGDDDSIGAYESARRHELFAPSVSDAAHAAIAAGVDSDAIARTIAALGVQPGGVSDAVRERLRARQNK
jgi:hypothetical protein